ncbi:endonuclease domain-containing protein [Microbispora sp. NPDC049125]|uniref:endonuclease domain-containing protein n=1 Tax=Microbispora sp. NPDC049125 TaxID=3154929 RepID=UPI0034671A69
MARSWVELPTGRVILLGRAAAEAVALSVEPLPDAAPAVITYFPRPTRSAADAVSAALAELESAAADLFPAWLPEADGIDGPGGANVAAVRALASRTASVTRNFGPFLADLAERALRGSAAASGGFAPEVRAAGLARVLARSFGRDRVALLFHVPAGLSPAGEEVLVAAGEWLAARGGFGVWLTGAPLAAVDRLQEMSVRLPDGVAGLPGLGSGTPPADPPPLPAVRYPAVAGRPHPASRAEKALEAALTSRRWASGRAWNQTYQSHVLTNPIRVDLLWRDERCAVEIDGSEHRSAAAYEADHRRDVRLQMDGFAVLRFTNTHVLTELDTVLRQLEQFLHKRRNGTFEGSSHG